MVDRMRDRCSRVFVWVLRDYSYATPAGGEHISALPARLAHALEPVLVYPPAATCLTHRTLLGRVDRGCRGLYPA